ncbi:hypothetical protein Ahy_A01g000140 [Arachis hypogaea]|uniref:Ferritin/DPS domain-containing protein n=1 Tax=Arachis hypogaea TaxID=3818 RepID=A0A445EJR9_ARAHY|nr:hypothetical protein Ahy_A01g000140 [Arachis hypogaea]
MVVENCKFFKESSEEEREHAEKLMKYQNIRGGRVTLHPITGPPSEFAHAEKGDALYAIKAIMPIAEADAIIRDILQMLDEAPDVGATCTPRKGNKLAHQLAAMTAELQGGPNTRRFKHPALVVKCGNGRTQKEILQIRTEDNIEKERFRLQIHASSLSPVDRTSGDNGKRGQSAIEDELRFY